MVPHRIYIHNEEDEATDSEGNGKTLRYRPSHNYSQSYRITGSGTFVGHGFQIGEFGVKSIPEHLISEAPSGLKHAKNETVILSTIGRGSSGYVSLGLHVPTLTTVAIKHFNVGMADRRQDMIRELNALYTINKNNRLSAKNVCHFKPVLSQYIVQLYDAYTDSEHRVCMLLEYMACGSLQKWIDQEGMMNETDCAVVAHSVVQALCVIHSRGIIHRDIKVYNTLTYTPISVYYCVELACKYIVFRKWHCQVRRFRNCCTDAICRFIEYDDKQSNLWNLVFYEPGVFSWITTLSTVRYMGPRYHFNNTFVRASTLSILY